MDFLKRLILQVIILFLGGLPAWFFLTVRYLLNPNGFWQNLILLGAGFYMLGTVQILFLCLALPLSFKLWFDS